MPINLYPSVAKVKRNGAYQNLPGFVQQSGDADIEAMIANKETSTTAQFPHAKDSFFILNDILYQADEDIPVNGTIAVGTNCHVDVLGNNVSKLNEDVASQTIKIDDFLNMDESVYPSTKWQQGSLSNGQETSSNSRIRTVFIPYTKGTSIEVAPESGYSYEIDFYNSNKVYQSYIGWVGAYEVFKSSTDGFVRFILRKSDNTPISTDACSNITIKISPPALNVLGTFIKTAKSININDPSLWAYGTRSNNGSIDLGNTRIFSNYFQVKKNDVVSALYDNSINGCVMYFDIVLYDNELNFISSTGWVDNAHRINADGYASINIRKRNDSAITEEEKETLIASIIYNSGSPQNNGVGLIGENIKAINHRGWGDAPENTLPAYVQSYQHGFKYVETDIRFTSDGVPVCLHDATINRTGRNEDGTEISSTINIGDITYEQSQNYDFGIYKGASYAGTKLPKLTEFLALCKALNLHPYIDFGTSPLMTKDEIETIVDACIDAGMIDHTTFIVGVFNYGIYITQKCKTARLGVISSLNSLFCKYAQTFMTGFNSVFMDTQYSDADSTTVENAKEYNLPVEIWTVNQTSIIDGMDEYISGVTSDLINVNTYLEDKNDGDIIFETPTATIGRVTLNSGGYIKIGRMVYVSMKFTATTTHTSSPGIFTNLPLPQNGHAVLSCVRSPNAISSEITSQVPCAISTYNGVGNMYTKEITNEAIYFVTGIYMT